MAKQSAKKATKKPATSKSRTTKKANQDVGIDVLIYSLACILVGVIIVFLVFG